MCNRIKTQVNILIRQKGANSCFLLLMLCVICNYVRNLIIYQNLDRADIPNFLAISTWAIDNKFGWYILTFIAFLVVLPGGFSLAKDKKTRIDIQLINRCGGKMNYYISKIVAVMIVTFCCFAIPFFIELTLNLCAFPIEASKEWLSVEIVYRQTEGMTKDFYLYQLYHEFPILYASIRIVIASALMSLLSLIPLAFSCVCYKYYAYLLLPIYFLIALFEKTTFNVFNYKITHNYFSYFWWGNSGVTTKELIIFSMLIILLSLIAIIYIFSYVAKGEKEN